MAGIMGGGLGRRRGPPLSADINVTSLVDVAFVLLIIFMITAPIMQGGIDVELPKAQATPLSSKDGVVVSINRQGQIFIDNQRVSRAEFQATIRRFVDQRNTSSVYVRGDANAPYGSVVRVLAALREAGITGAGIVTEEEEIGR
ncbi:MAG: ExbD/TolR family protein [Gemmatimonadetes bacterium]|nr:ExbD/TolR family protein [Gemmatimonadota bacterium]